MPGTMQPGPAERLRTMLAAAASLTLHTPDQRTDLIGRHRLDETGRVVIELPRCSHLALQVAHDGALAAIVELTDVAPVAVRRRIRARATLRGWLTPAAGPSVDPGEHLAALDLAAARLAEPGGTTDVDLEAFAAARPDPLASAEAELLCHVTDRHPEAIESLARLVPAAQLHGVRHVIPLRLDRFGIVLRLEFASRHRDVRLPFATPLEHANEAATRMYELLTRASRCRRPIGH